MTKRQASTPLARQRWGRPHIFRLSLLALALPFSTASQALDYGPFTLTGFFKSEFQRGSNYCIDCQRFPDESKDRFWADEVVPGREFKTTETHVTLFQPYLGAKFDLGRGFKLSGLISKRWRDGKEDIKGFWYDKNVAISHEDYGSLRIGAMTTRAWSVADYPYGTNIGVADVWASSGAGYGLLTNAARYTSRTFDVLEGDLVLEATYDRGNTRFKINKPRFIELYAQFHRGDLVVDAMYQDSRNGNPQAWGHGPFTGLTPFPVDDALLGGSGQSIGMVMARYQIDSRFEVSGGIRGNRWSGAYAVITKFGPPAQWNNMFNVDWNGTLNGVANPGYPARSVDFMAGLRYRTGKWTASTGLTYLGKASTANPSERGQSNTALVNTAGLSYEVGSGLQLYGFAGMVHYGRLGLSPMSMPGNSAFTNVDSRVNRNGNWAGVGAVYVF
jgi:predicted porin